MSVKSTTGLLLTPGDKNTTKIPIPEERNYEQGMLLHQQYYVEQRRAFTAINRQQEEKLFGEGYGYSESNNGPPHYLEHKPSMDSPHIRASGSQRSMRTSNSSKYSYNVTNL
jgi:hypothetical protein